MWGLRPRRRSEMKPLEALHESLHKRVLVEMKGGRSFRGVLDAYDQHLNLVLSSAEEVVAEEVTPHSGMTLLRGDSIVYISP
ncbi:MAG: small nuclear ribonucleoprotein [Thermoplasmata archaeon]|nr:small nuclear ribonucleoprotein [Thermoplasmata archaeon]